jgi:hypothetical protein
MRRRGREAVAIAGALALVLAMGCCLFDGHDTPGQGTLSALCHGLLAVSLAPANLAPPPAAGWAVRAPVVTPRLVAHRTPDPPPRLARPS